MRCSIGEMVMLINNEQYFTVVENIKSEIKNAKYREAVSVNSELVMLYHTIGKEIRLPFQFRSFFVV